jgi:Domain of unknown function (DUF4395)
VQPGSGDLDERELRASQAAVAVLLLGAFVFQVPPLVVGVTVVVAIGAAFGPRWNVFHRVYRAVVGPRLQPPRAIAAPAAARVLDTLATALLLLACGAFAVGIDGIGWFFALIEAAVATVEATTGYNAAADLYERIRREQ